MQRLTESKLGVLLGCLLGIVWIASMSIADASPCTLPPVLWSLALIVLVALICIGAGMKVVRLPLAAWLSLGIGVYFLVRACMGFSLMENWADCGLILGGMVFYMAGIYCGQLHSSRGEAIVLTIAILLNIFFMYHLQDESVSLNWVGRADTGLAGPNTRNTSLFVYKNFSGLFLTLAGALMLWRSILNGKITLKNSVFLLIGLAGISVSFFCDTRQVWVVLPITLLLGWILWLVNSLYANKPISWGIIVGGIAILVGVCVVIYDFLVGHDMAELFFSVDTHIRAFIWDCICDVAYNAPLYGYGPGGSTWEIVPTYREASLPNYAHNEYVQAWADYGLIGLGLMVATILLHVVEGFRALASDTLDKARRVKIAVAMVCLLTLSATAMGDYVWHSFALVSMTAFACGTLVSPVARPPMSLFSRRNWAPGQAPSPRPIRAENHCGKVVLLASGLALLTALCKLSNTLTPACLAQYKLDAMIHSGASADEQRRLLMDIVRSYPDSRITDHYIQLAPTTTPDWSLYTEEELDVVRDKGLMIELSEPDWTVYEQALRAVLAANSRQLFAATALGQVLDKQSRFEEAELIFRTYYPADGPDNRQISCWATIYTAHLQQWGHSLLLTDDLSKAWSMLDYADKLAKKTGYIPSSHHNYRSNRREKIGTGILPRQQALQRGYAKELAVLRYINPPKDDSWMQPMQPGGKPALYQRYQIPKK